MKCMEYANKNHVNIIPQQDFEDLALEVFNVIATNIGRSLGPLGSSATIFDGSIVEATKDGYSILDKYTFNNIYKRMIYNLIKKPCTAMNNTVGDGTTTAIVLTNALYELYKQNEALFYTLCRLPRQFINAWDEVIADVVKRIEKKAKPIDPEDYDTIYHIAYVTSNGNKEISEAFAKTYQEAKSPAIKKKDSPTNESYISPVNGFEFPANAIDNCYVRNQDLSAVENDVVVMIFNHTIETDLFKKVIEPINKCMRSMKKKMIIIAPAYDEYMMETTLRQSVNEELRTKGEINLILTQYRNSDLTPHQLEDLSVVLRAKFINKDLASSIIEYMDTKTPEMFIEDVNDPENPFHRCIGSAGSVLITCKNGSIYDPVDIENDTYYQEALTRAKADLDDIMAHTDYERQSYAAKIYDARSRVLQLEMKNYIYYIGADSELQKQILDGYVDDVIKCLRSAIKYGSVPGCQLSIINSCDEAINDILNSYNGQTVPEAENLKVMILEIILHATKSVYAKVLQGPDRMGIIKTIKNWPKRIDNEHNRSELEKEAATKLDAIITESIQLNKTFDLETLEYSEDIITSAQTDIMVLKSASELVKILISGNQCIFIDHDMTDSHQDEVPAYV